MVVGASPRAGVPRPRLQRSVGPALPAARRLATPHVPACRGANDNGCGPLSQPVWPGTWWSGSEHMGSPQTGSWDAGALQGLGELCLGSRCLGLTEEAGCWSPSLFRTHQGYRFNNTKGHMASCPLQPSGSPTGQSSLAGLGAPGAWRALLFAAFLEVSTLRPLLPVVWGPPHVLGTPIDLGGIWLASNSRVQIPVPKSLCLFCVVLELCGSLHPHSNRKDRGDVRMLKLLWGVRTNEVSGIKFLTQCLAHL